MNSGQPSPRRYPGPGPVYFEPVPGFDVDIDYTRCPYDKNHIIPKKKVNDHLMRCRKNYKERMKLEGIIPKLTCQYNINHDILAPELRYHESVCPDRHRVWHYQLNVIEYFKDDFKFPMGTTWKNYRDEKEVDEMYEGLLLDVLVGADTFGVPTPIDQIGQGTGTDQFRSWAPEPKEKDQSTKLSPEQLLPSVSEGFTTDTGSVSGSASTEIRGCPTNANTIESAAFENPFDEDINSASYWESNCDNPTFNYIESAHNPRRPIFRFPPGMTKSERNWFVKFNTNWLERIASAKKKQEEEQEQKKREDENTPQPVSGQNSPYRRDKARFLSTNSERSERSAPLSRLRTRRLPTDINSDSSCVSVDTRRSSFSEVMTTARSDNDTSSFVSVSESESFAEQFRSSARRRLLESSSRLNLNRRTADVGSECSVASISLADFLRKGRGTDVDTSTSSDED